jgi:hypothetical protein
MSYRSVCGARLYVQRMLVNKKAGVVEADKWEAFARLDSLLSETDIELQYVGSNPVVSRRLPDCSSQAWGVAPHPAGESRPSGRYVYKSLLCSLG